MCMDQTFNYSGSCLCGNINFFIHQDIKTIYYCHCSLCRKQSGTASNAATLVNQSFFEWTAGVEYIEAFKKASGFSACFCKLCGSPVPNQVSNSTWMWIPLGLLNELPNIQTRLSFCLHSKINWAPAITVDHAYSELPNRSALDRYFT